MTELEQRAAERLRLDDYDSIDGRFGRRMTGVGGEQQWEDLQIVKDAYLALVTPEREAERRELCEMLKGRMSRRMEWEPLPCSQKDARRLLAFLEGTKCEPQ